MKNSSQEIVTLILLKDQRELLQGQREEIVKKGKALRKDLATTDDAISHIELAILAIESSPLNEAIEARIPQKGLLSQTYEPIRPGVVARIVNSFRGDHAD